MSTRLMRRLPHRTRTAILGGDQVVKKKWERVVVIGFGPAGRAVVDGLMAKRIPLIILEMNPNTVAENRMIFPIELGDATQTEVLQHVGVGASVAVVVTAPDPNACRLIVGAVQRLAPGVPILARVRYHQYAMQILQAGASKIVDEEQTVGLHLASEAIELALARQASKA
jgi:CPA2 family monovalent cation:H+ antiporter-2